MSLATAIPSGTAAIPVEHAAARRTFLSKVLVFVRRQPLGTLGLVLVVVTVAVLTNLVVDLLYVWLDPRIRLN